MRYASRGSSNLFSQLRNVMKRSSSNGCLSIWQTIIFPRMILCPTLVIGIRSFQHLIVRKDTVSTVMGSNMLSEALPIILIYLTKVINTQAVMDVCPYDWSCAPNWIFGLIFECLFGRKEAVLVTLRGWDIMSEALLIILIYLRKVGNQPQAAMDICPYDTELHFLRWSCAQNWWFGFEIWILIW